MLLLTRRFFAALLLLALPLKGVVGVWMAACAGMGLPVLTHSATDHRVAEVLPPCHESMSATAPEAPAAMETEAVNVPACSHCGPCMAPMAGFEPPAVTLPTGAADAPPVIQLLLPTGRSDEVPQPPPRA